MKTFPLAVGVCLFGCALAAVPGRGQPSPPAASVSPAPAPAAAVPPVVARYEQMLAASPGKGTAFDKVYQSFFEGEGLDALAARWHARAKDTDTFLLLEGLLAERRTRPDDARERYTAYTKRHPEDPRGWTALGELETAEGRFGASADALAHALAPDARPPVPAAARPALYRELARAQTREFLVAASLATWRKLAAEFPDDPTVLQEVGEALQEGQEYDDARFTFAKLRDLAGHNGDAFGRINATLHLGQVEEARGNSAEAVKVYEGVVADAKAGSWLEREARARIEQLYRSQEDLPGLSEYYKKWLADHPRDLEVATRRAAVLVELNHRDEAIDLLRQAVAWAPDRQELQVELARRLAEAERPAEAAAVMERLTAVAPEEKSYWVLLGDARWQLLLANPPGASAADKAKWRQGALDAWGHLALPDSRDGVEAGSLADLLAAHRLPDEALAQYARGAALSPELIDLRERWASYLTGLDRRDEAKAVLAGTITASPKNATAANYSRLATALDRLDDTDGALDATAKGLALEPRNFDVLAQRWDLLAARKRWDDALALYPALLAAAPGVFYAEQVQARHVSALAAAGKLSEVRQGLAARLNSQTPPLDEAELCLLIRLDLQGGDTGDHPDDTRAALDEARRTLTQGNGRFPRSVALTRAGIELARRAHDPAAQVAALRHLAELQPAQKTDALEQIVRVWRDASRPDDAVAAARELVAASPASAPAHALLADLLLANGHPDEGLGYLREAVGLSDRPNEVRQRLATAQADLGRNADARKTLDEAFEAAADSHERLAMTKGLAEAYQREGKLDELIARFQRGQQAEADGWRYALYLAEIYETTQDTAGARRELAKALSARPKDGSLLRQLVRLAANEENAAEFARYQRLLAEAEPSDVNQLALVKALLANDEGDAALDALAAHLSAIVKIPGAWDELLPLLTQKALTGKAGDLLTRELGGEKANARNRFTLALFQMTAGYLDEAKAALWGIFALRSPLAAAPIKPPAPSVVAPGDAYMVFYGDGGTPADLRLTDAARARAFAQTLLDPEAAQSRQSLGLANGAGSTPPSVALAGRPDPLDTTRDAALIYLAAIAVKQDATVPFLAELDRRLAARDSSRADRLVAYASVNATGELLREIAAQARAPESDLDIFCCGQLFSLAANYEQVTAAAASGNAPPDSQPRLTPAQIDTLGPLAEVLFRRVTLLRPETAEILDVMRIAFYNALGRKDQAREIQRAFLARIDEHASPALLSEALGLLVAGDLDAEDRAQVRTLARALAAQISRARSVSLRQGAVNLPQAVFANTEGGASKLPPADLAATLADLMVLWYPAAPPPVPGTPVPAALTPRFWVTNGGQNGDGTFLPSIRYLETDMTSGIEGVQSQLQQKASGDDGPALGKALHDALARQSQELPAAQRLYPLMVSVYLDFASGEMAAALATAQALLAERPGDTDLRLLVAMILARGEQPKEAVALLQAAGEIHDPEAARCVQYGILTFAEAAEDKETARAAAQRLAAMRVPLEERDELVEKLRSFDLKDEADRLDHSTSAVAAQAAARRRNGMPARASVLDYDTLQQLQALEKDKNTAGALALVKNVLAALPAPAPTADQADSVAGSALQTLDRLHKRGEFIDEARWQLASDPDSLTLNYQLALLCGPTSAEQSREGYTRHQNNDLKAPVWLRLTRSGGEVIPAFSQDGKRWTRFDHVPVPLGDSPEAAVAVLSWGDEEPEDNNKVTASGTVPAGAEPSPTDTTIGATVDNLALKPAADTPDAWTESAPETAAPAEAATPSGIFTLRGSDNGQEVPDWDALSTVHRPLGAAQQCFVRIAAFTGAEDRTRPAVALIFRASRAPDAPLAALIVGRDGHLTFAVRQGPDESLPYWRKLAQLRPKEARYTRLLATHLAQAGKWNEAAALYDGLFTRDPGEIISHSTEFSTFYQHDVARLANLLLNWQSGPANGRQGNPASFYTDVARRCVAARRDDLAVPLARRAIELNAAGGNRFDPDDNLLLLDALVRLRRRDEAREVLTRLFVPPSMVPVAAGVSAPRLGFESPQARALPANTYFYWFTNANWNNDVPTLPGVTALESVRPLGLLPDLEAALRARLAEPDGKQFVHSAPDWTLVFSRLVRHDPTILAELPARLNARDWINEEMLSNFPAGAVALRVVVAELLLQWPGHEGLAMEALRYPESLRKKMNGNGSTFPASYDLLVARVAFQLGDAATATAIARAVGERVLPPGAKRKSAERVDPGEVQACLASLLRAGTPEADRTFDEFFDRASEYPDLKKQMGDSYVLERAQRAAAGGRYTARAWLLDDGAGAGGDATLVYELRPRYPGDKAGPKGTLNTRGRPLAIPGGERKLTFFYGRDARQMEAIGETKTAGTFGTGRGRVPDGAGFLRVAGDTPPDLDPKGAADIQGAPLRILRTANLWKNPEFEGLSNRDPDAPKFSLPGWKDLPAGFWLPGTFNGPLPGKAYVQCEIFPHAGQSFYGERVPVEADHAYLQSAWLRDGGDDTHAVFGRRYLDAQGKVLKTSHCNYNVTPNWQRPVQRLDPKGADADGDQIPPGTAFIEPFVEFNGAADWTGLFLGRAD